VATEQRTFAWPDNTVWLASYPRSGNTYLRAILWTCFGLRSASVYADDCRATWSYRSVSAISRGLPTDGSRQIFCDCRW